MPLIPKKYIRDDANAEYVGNRRKWTCPRCYTVHWAFKNDVCLNEWCPSKENVVVPKITRTDHCIACRGSGKNSKGDACYPCFGTGIKRHLLNKPQPEPEIKLSLAERLKKKFNGS